MHSHHIMSDLEKTERVAPLIAAKKITESSVHQFSADEIVKLQRLTPLILAGKISESKARTKHIQDVEKLERVTPLIITGRLSEFGACKMSLMEIENKLFTHGHPGTFFEASTQHLHHNQHLHSVAAITLKN